MRTLVALVVAALALGSESWPNPPPPPLAGFSFSPLTSVQAGRDPADDLNRLLEATQPDLVRLPIYWELVQPAPTQLDFSSVDPLLAVVAARNFLFPELHQPTWAGDRSQPSLGLAQAGLAYRNYFDESITRYRSSPLLYAWQVENEPLDKVVNAYTEEDRISDAQLTWEVGEVHRLDPDHKAVVTSYNALNVTLDLIQRYTPIFLGLVGGGSGHPSEALRMGDVFGLDLYVDGPSVPYRGHTSIPLRSQWKEQSLTFWADRAHSQGKDIWVAEMQAQPWNDGGTFEPANLVQAAIDYRQAPLDVVLLWGVETWLDDPGWMSAAARALTILRT